MALRKTTLSNALESADAKTQYDENIKNILSNKIILAWILKYTVGEFFDETVEQIMELIEGPPEISSVPIYPGKSNTLPRITGSSTEDKIPTEGEITYDIKFVVFTPGGERIKMIVNIEAQKDFYPGYDLITRGVFYGARMLSAQLDTEFTTDNYDDIKKVYSIWICMQAPKHSKNTITSYKMSQNKLYGNYHAKARFDLLEVVMVCLGEIDDDIDSQLINMLNTLLSNKISVNNKKNILEDKFGISSTVKLDKEMVQMCNLSDIVFDEAIEKGMAQGMEKGIEQGKSDYLVRIVDNFVVKNNVTFEQALDMLSVTLEEYETAKKVLAEI